jgi:hypothetical protein
LFVEYLIPLPRAKVKLLFFLHVRYDIVNAPRLILIARGVIGWQFLYVRSVRCPIIDRFDSYIVVLICVCLRIVLEDPRWQLRLCAARVELDLAPVGILEKFGIGEAQFLGAGCADEAVKDFIN